MTPRARPATAAKGPAAKGTPGGKVEPKLVISGNVAKLRKTFLWKLVTENPDVKKELADKEFQQFVTKCGVDPLKAVDRVSFALGARGWKMDDPERFAVLVHGRFDTDKTLNCLKTLPRKTGATVVEKKVNGRLVFEITEKDGDKAHAISVANGVGAMCHPTWTPAVLAQDLTFKNADIARRMKGVNREALAWLVFGPVPLTASMLKGAPPPLAAIKRINGGSVQLDTADGKWTLQVKVGFGSPEEANKVAGFLKLARTQLPAMGIKLPPPVTKLINEIQLSTTGSTLLAKLNVPEATLKAFAPMALQMLK